MSARPKRTAIILLLLLLAAGSLYYTLQPKYKLNTSYVRQGETRIKNRNPEIKIWDWSMVDGDTINVYFDGKRIYKNLGLVEEPVVYRPGRLSPGLHEISIEALNEGDVGRASPHLSISDRDTVIEFDIRSFKDSVRSSWIINVE